MNEYPHLIIHKGEKRITSVDNWFLHAPPKSGEKHWVDGRSAKELAKAWASGASPKVPVELEQLLASSSEFRGTVLTLGTPEMSIPLDNFRGETRNADMVLWGFRRKEKIIITVEAKADEAFGDPIEKKLASVKGDASKIPERVALLAESMLGIDGPDDQRLWSLKYQLLHASAATLIAANENRADKALFLIHEFETDKTTLENMKRNQEDLDYFVRLLSRKQVEKLSTGAIIGPFEVPGSRFINSDIGLYIGKIRTTLKKT
jgi:hypothetical protein